MKSDVILINNNADQIDKALDQVEAIAVYKSLPARERLHLRLLSEELMGMVRSMIGETEVKFWIEDAYGVYQIHLLANTIMDSVKRGQLLSASTSGKNEEAKGFIGMLKEFFYRTSDIDAPIHGNFNSVRPGSPVFWNYSFEPAVDNDRMFAPAAAVTMGVYEHNVSQTPDYEWSLNQYKSGLERNREKDDEAGEAWVFIIGIGHIDEYSGGVCPGSTGTGFG